jgi:dipeptidyl aminopeptidase/acylaminoacyl peptidase
LAVRAADAPTPLSVYGHLPAVEDVALSPDGSRVAYIRTLGDQRLIAIQALTGDRKPSIIRAAEVKLRGIQWIDDDNLLIITSSTGVPRGLIGADHELYMLQICNVGKRKLTNVDFRVSNEDVVNVAEGIPMTRVVNGSAQLFVPGAYVEGHTKPGMFRMDLAHHSTQLVTKGSEPLTRWLVDDKGQIAAEFDYRERTQQWSVRARKGDRLTVMAEGQTTLEIPYMVGFSADGASIVVRFIENGDPVWKSLSLADGSWSGPISDGMYYDHVIEDRITGRIIGGVSRLDNTYTFLDPKIQAQWNSVARALNGQRIDLVSHTDDFSKFIVRVFGAKKGFDYALFDRNTRQLDFFSPVYEGLKQICDVKPVSYPAADGLEITGYLTLPCSGSEKGLPLVVLPHGGPASADTNDFHWWAQALATQGYAVLQPNFRGSSLSTHLVSAGYGEWGRKMQSDLSDGVRYLAQQGTIDPQRVCIVGASYGGYAALAGVTLESGVYRCAVSVAGIGDLKRLLKWTDFSMGRGNSVTQHYWDRFMGVSGPRDPALDSISPIEHVSAVNVPVLLIHGRDDTVVPYEQSQVMFDALKRAGKSAELVTLKNEDHWLSHSATRLQMLEASVAFLKTNNPAD